MRHVTLNRKNRVMGIALIVTVLLLLAQIVAASPGYDLSWYTMAGGGGHSEAGTYSLDATIGQSVSGRVASASTEICAGFWCFTSAQYKTYLPVVLKNL